MRSFWMATFQVQHPKRILISAMLPLLLLATTFKPSLSYHLGSSSISVPPSSSVPKMPKFSIMPPALSPDIMPVFPSPKTGIEAPSSSLPTIPSSPSPPNPDDLDPNSAFAPYGAMATATSSGSSLGDVKRVPVAFLSGILVFLWWLVMAR